MVWRIVGIGGWYLVEKLVLDTGVIIEYIILKSPYRDKVARLFSRSSINKLKLYVSLITLSETLYIVSRIYQVAGLENPNEEALNFIEWVKNRVQVIGIDEDIALRAGELKKQLRIALPDCYVIASAESINAKPLFKRLEEEMKPVINELRKFNVIFLDKINI